ncbi:MAG: hypothetical protein A2939_03325 [Parcubacteria group bacterium RIFCSPLOWO2_01_FULL_48_18]|nr:MAG: hypothetical protein A2939_03325 [Parcubacteria group bacterium RIFCSPLOWO2_01_FULL_48_18]
MEDFFCPKGHALFHKVIDRLRALVSTARARRDYVSHVKDCKACGRFHKNFLMKERVYVELLGSMKADVR